MNGRHEKQRFVLERTLMVCNQSPEVQYLRKGQTQIFLFVTTDMARDDVTCNQNLNRVYGDLQKGRAGSVLFRPNYAIFPYLISDLTKGSESQYMYFFPG